MSAPELVYELYRSRAHGTSRDWAIAITDGGEIRTIQCPTGQIVRRTHVPRARFDNARDERSRLIDERIANGFERVGLATIESNRLVPATPPPTVASGAYWEISRAISIDEIRERLAWAVEQLRDHVAPDLIQFDVDSVVFRTTESNQVGARCWVFGFCDEGGIQACGRGGGQILLEHGLLPRLIILYMQKCFPDAIQLSDEMNTSHLPQVSRDDVFLGQGMFDYERMRALGERLNLCIGSVSSRGIQNGSNAFWL